ncbi:uncharacterized protein LOC113212171 isoform X4 [Frankliniella occidentalis]|uniref:Uncharacterized protein LOC113212171 isoform X4 n=1 Tax=Frankliniella occidentalis TaxID=133901 RepID=A0A9C6XDE4_FRAOC|nr:uncharacterized protein LOC113212171 isoform X4 [Frankliniella occidentalis]
MGHRGGDDPLCFDGVVRLAAPCASTSDTTAVEADAAEPYLARSVSAVDSGFRDDDLDDSASSCSSATSSCYAGSNSSVSVKDLVHSALHADEPPMSFGDISVRHSENVQIGNNTHFHGKVTVVLSSSKSVNGVAVPAVLPAATDPDLLLALDKGPVPRSPDGSVPPGDHGGHLGSNSCRIFHKRRWLTPRRRFIIRQPRPGKTKERAGAEQRAVSTKFWTRPCFYIPVALGTLLVSALAITAATLSSSSPTPTARAQLPNGLTLVPRDEWVAAPPRDGINHLTTPVEYVIIHHSASDMCYSNPECVKQTRHIQQYHMESRNWSDIAYNFLVGGNGYAYVGRGWDQEGAHTFNWNARSVGVCLIGTFTYGRPTIEQMRSTLQLLEWGVTLGKVAPGYKLAGVCQMRSTESPGRQLFSEIKRWEHWWNYTVGDSYCK